MNVVGVIPARGRSKSISRKNLATVGGRSLIAYTFDVALASRKLTRTVLSTDDEEVAALGRKSGIGVPFMRPIELAADDTPMLDVLRHAVSWLTEHEGYEADVVVLLQPTSPMRRSEHIDAAVEILCETGADSVVSVVEVPHQFNPVSQMRLEHGRLLPFQDGPMILRRQDKPMLFARNGPAVLAVRLATLRNGSLYGEDCRPLVMNAEDSIDIDEPWQLALADLMLSSRKAR